MTDSMIDRFHWLRRNSLSAINPIAYCPVNAPTLLTIIREREAIPTIGGSRLLSNGSFQWEVGDAAFEWALFSNASNEESFAAFFLVHNQDSSTAVQHLTALMKAFDQSSLYGVERENTSADECSDRVKWLLACGRGVPGTELLGL